MLRLNRLTDYAMVVMVHLSRADDLVSAQRLAEESGLPRPTVAKLLAVLARHGLAEAQRGANGGYALGQRAEEISVADIIEALEGPVALTACVEGGDHLCSREQFCSVRGHWDKVNAAIRCALGGVSLAEMARADDVARAWAPARRTASETERLERVRP